MNHLDKKKILEVIDIYFAFIIIPFKETFFMVCIINVRRNKSIYYLVKILEVLFPEYFSGEHLNSFSEIIFLILDNNPANNHNDPLQLSNME